MMLASVPVLSSEWSGTGTEVVVSEDRFCITMWLPRCRTGAKPCASKILHTSRPDSRRSLPNQHLDLRDEDFSMQPASDFGWIR